MTQPKISVDDVGKTSALLALGNTFLAPLYWVDSKLGLTAAIVATGAFLYSAHEIGKNRRTLGNAANKANTFFGGLTGKSTEVENTLANIATGGAALFDEMIPPSKVN